jgi:apolipoprotein N-acyltransferase
MRSVLDKKFVWIFIVGCIASLAFAPYYIMGLFPVAISALMLYVLRSESYKESFMMGWIFGCGYFLSGLYWIAYPLLFYFLDTFWWLAPLVILVGPCVLGLYPGLCCLVMYRLKRLNSIAFALCFICFWVFLEFLRTKLFTGFPWLVAGYSLMAWPAAIQSSSTFGLFGLSFIVLCLSIVPFALIACPNRTKKILTCIIVTGLFIANVVYGACVLYRNPTILAEYKVKIVQPNVDGLITRANMDSTARSVIELAKINGTDSGQLLYVLLPEGTLSSFTSQTFAELIRTSVPEHGYLLSGGDRKEYIGGRLKAWNSIFVFDKHGQVIDMYDKTHLVPFGEYMPMRGLLPDSLHAVVAYSGVFPDFSAGTQPRAIEVGGKFSFCPLICYESLFSNSVRDADLLINFTTDMWYKNSSGPYQHFDMGKLRAVEYGIPFIRGASTGISGIIDPYGRVLAHLPLGEPGVLVHDIPLRSKVTTLYARLGDSLVLTIIGFIFVAAIYFG